MGHYTLDTAGLLTYGLDEKTNRESAYSQPTPRISDWEVPHAVGYHDVHPSRQADHFEGKPGDIGAGRLPLRVLRAGWKSHFRECAGDARGLCRSTSEEGQKKTGQPGGLLRPRRHGGG